MTKKFLSVLLAVLMLASIVPVYAFAEDDVLSYLTYVISNGEVTILECDTSISGDVVIPDTIEGYPVTSIQDAFADCNKIDSIVIPATVTYIAMQNGSGLPDSLVSIFVDENNQYFSSDEYGVLYNKNKTKLVNYPKGNTRTSFDIPDSVKTIGEYSFEYCDSLVDITIPASVENINSEAFRCCVSLKNIIIPDSVKSIAYSAFSMCSSLESVSIGSSVEYMDSSAFHSCGALTNIQIAAVNQYYSSDEYGILYNKDKTTLITYPIGNERTSVIIPDSVTTIGSNSFAYCDSLISITISASVTEIEGYAFIGCDSLTEINISDSPMTIGHAAFADTGYYYDSDNWDNGVLYIGKHLIYTKSYVTECVIKEGTLDVGLNAFDGCKKLTSITVPDSVVVFAASYLYDCTKLNNITVDSNNEYYSSDEYGVLYNKDKTTLIQYPIGNTRTTFEIPYTVCTISYGSFDCSNSLTSIVIPTSVKSIELFAFNECNSLEKVYYRGSQNQWNLIAIGHEEGYYVNSYIHNYGLENADIIFEINDTSDNDASDNDTSDNDTSDNNDSPNYDIDVDFSEITDIIDNISQYINFDSFSNLADIISQYINYDSFMNFYVVFLRILYMITSFGK